MCISLASFHYATAANSLSPICGEWTGTKPPEGYPQLNEQKWILTFRQDNSFSFVFVEKGTPMPGLEGSYSASASNVVIQLPEGSSNPLNFNIDGENLRLNFSEFTTMLGWGKGVDQYIRTKKVKDLSATLPQPLLNEGRYKLTVVIAKGNDEKVLKDVFGTQYKETYDKPIDGGTWQIHNLKGRNIIQLSQEQFGPPEFNGKSFKVFGALPVNINGDFIGEIVSATKVKGTFKSQSTTLHGTFTLERSGGLDIPAQY